MYQKKYEAVRYLKPIKIAEEILCHQQRGKWRLSPICESMTPLFCPLCEELKILLDIKYIRYHRAIYDKILCCLNVQIWGPCLVDFCT